MSFSYDLKRFSNKVEDNGEKIVRGTALALFRLVILRSPVKTGRFRGNWQAAINHAVTGTKDLLDTSGNKAIAETAANTARFKLGQSIYLVNNLPYAIKLEKGSSKQAPVGMVRVSVAQFQREIDKQARKLK